MADSVYLIFGDCDASPKLVRAALSDQLSTHLADSPDDDFWLCLGLRKRPPAIYSHILAWAEKNEVYTVVYGSEDPGASEFVQSDRFMLDAVERCFDEVKQHATVFALLGDDPPATDVARALARAHDNGMVLRDLAEAGLTYVRPTDDPLPPPKEHATMAEQELTLEEVGVIADDNDHDDQDEAIAALVDVAKEAGLDPDDYATWSELAEALAEAEDEDDESDDDDDDDDESDPEPGELDEDELRALDLPALRKLAAQAGIEGAEKKRKDTLVRELASGSDDDDDDDEPEEKPAKAASKPAAKSKPAASASDEEEEVLSALRTLVAYLRK